MTNFNHFTTPCFWDKGRYRPCSPSYIKLITNSGYVWTYGKWEHSSYLLSQTISYSASANNSLNITNDYIVGFTDAVKDIGRGRNMLRYSV